ncbi:MAG TPA: TetR family transcriptional regulator [Actinoplanes sp.]|nr:TetR family transcriptional regulator [Actinoplanes sp.]
MTGLRERKKAETRRSIQAHALRLFLDKGYDNTTVEEIAAAAGVSHMTFFRYFSTKHAVVEYDDYDPVMAELIRARPSTEDPLTAIRRALTQAMRAMPASEVATVLVRARLILGVPALRARQIESQRSTRELFAAAIDGRGETTPFHREVVAAVALTMLTAAIEAWAASDRPESLPDLVDDAFEALNQG